MAHSRMHGVPLKIKILLMILLSPNVLSQENDITWHAAEFTTYTIDPVSNNEKVIEEFQTTTKPIVRDQDGFGTCYAFAITSLIDQACMKEGVCSKSRSISVLDVIARTQFDRDKDFGFDGGYMSSITKIFQNSQDNIFAEESCAPYQQILNYSKPAAEFDINNYPRLKALRDIYKETSNQYDENGFCLNCSKKFFQQYYDFSDQMIVKLNHAVSKLRLIKSFNEFLSVVLIPQTCRHKITGITLPKMTFEEDYIDSIADFRATIKSKVMSDKPVAINACTWQRECMNNIDSPINCSQEHRVRICAAHAFLLDGQRKICEESKCRYQYRVHNSWGKDFEWRNDNGWVNENTLYEGFKGFGDNKVTTVHIAIKK